MAFKRAWLGGWRNILAYGESVVAPMSFVLSPTTICGRSSREPPLIRWFFKTPYTTKQHLIRGAVLWWAEVDSNHRSRRRQIYSLIHLATLESAHVYEIIGAGDWTRTHNLLITNQLLCH